MAVQLFFSLYASHTGTEYKYTKVIFFFHFCRLVSINRTSKKITSNLFLNKSKPIIARSSSDYLTVNQLGQCPRTYNYSNYKLLNSPKFTFISTISSSMLSHFAPHFLSSIMESSQIRSNARQCPPGDFILCGQLSLMHETC